MSLAVRIRPAVAAEGPGPTSAVAIDRRLPPATADAELDWKTKELLILKATHRGRWHCRPVGRAGRARICGSLLECSRRSHDEHSGGPLLEAASRCSRPSGKVLDSDKSFFLWMVPATNVCGAVKIEPGVLAWDSRMLSGWRSASRFVL